MREYVLLVNGQEKVVTTNYLRVRKHTKRLDLMYIAYTVVKRKRQNSK